MINSKVLKRSIVFAVAISFLPFTTGVAQDSASSLQSSLQSAICQNDWASAIELTDSLLEIAAPSDRDALLESRREFISRHNTRSAVYDIPGCTEEHFQSAPIASDSGRDPNFDWARGLAAVGAGSSNSSSTVANNPQPVTIQFLRVEPAPDWSDFRRQVVGQVTNNMDIPLQYAEIYYEDISRVDGSTRIEGSYSEFIEDIDLMPGRSTMFTLPYDGDYVRLTSFDAVEGYHDLNQTYPNTR